MLLFDLIAGWLGGVHPFTPPPVPPPAEARTFYLATENRTFPIAAQDRTFHIAADDRTFTNV